MRRHHPAGLLCACLLLAGCGNDESATPPSSTAGSERLPKPDAAAGSVTGMPNPGTPATLPAPADSLGTDLGNAAEAMPAPDPGLPMPPVTADAASAVSVLRDYYAAINARDYGKAYAQWSDGGRASGQSLQQFSDGYATTQGVSVVLGEPGRVEGAAGSRYVEIPATLEATQSDGGVRHYAGSLTLRMTLVDGASDAQRRWHIAYANLREARR